MKSRIAAIGGALLVVAVLVAALWFVNKPGSGPVRAGDCVTNPKGGSYTKVGCGDSMAAYVVLAATSGADSSRCDAFPGVDLSVVSSDNTKTLCLKAHK